MSHLVRVSDSTWKRLQVFATPFSKSERGTPAKVIVMLLDAYEAALREGKV